MASKEYQREWYARNKDKCREYQRRYQERHPDKAKAVKRAGDIKRAYGISVEEYEKLMSEGCAICGDDAVHLDHDHDTGRVRKALCRRHNTGLGMFGDDPDELEKAVRYLRSHE